MDGDEVERKIPSPSRAISRWLNVVVDLNGILCVCAEYKFLPKMTIWNLEIALQSFSILARIDPKAISVRPSCFRFLSVLSNFANITILNSMHEPIIQKVCEYLFRGLRMPLHILKQDSCDWINVMDRGNKVTTMKVKGTHKDIFLKTLSKQLFNKFSGKFTKENIIIINNSLVKHIPNNSKNVLLPVSWLHNEAGPSETFFIDTLLSCLHELHKSQDVREATRVRHCIGQPILSKDSSRTDI